MYTCIRTYTHQHIQTHIYVYTYRSQFVVNDSVPDIYTFPNVLLACASLLQFAGAPVRPCRRLLRYSLSLSRPAVAVLDFGHLGFRVNAVYAQILATRHTDRLVAPADGNPKRLRQGM